MKGKSAATSLFRNEWSAAPTSPKRGGKPTQLNLSFVGPLKRHQKERKELKWLGQSEVDLLGVIGGCKPQATSQKRRRASQAECLSSLPSPSIMNEKNNWLRDGMKRWDWRANETNPLFSLQQLNNSLFCGCGWKSQRIVWVWFVVWVREWASWAVLLVGYGAEPICATRQTQLISLIIQSISFSCSASSIPLL